MKKLTNKYTTPAIREYVDQDYMSKLSESDQAFLRQFNDEYYGGSFKNNNSDLHKSPEQKKDCRNRINRARRDELGRKSVFGSVYRQDRYDDLGNDIFDRICDGSEPEQYSAEFKAEAHKKLKTLEYNNNRKAKKLK